jgi:uncharacterized membrane protein YjfL (UPF0719 family)
MCRVSRDAMRCAHDNGRHATQRRVPLVGGLRGMLRDRDNRAGAAAFAGHVFAHGLLAWRAMVGEEGLSQGVAAGEALLWITVGVAALAAALPLADVALGTAAFGGIVSANISSSSSNSARDGGGADAAAAAAAAPATAAGSATAVHVDGNAAAGWVLAAYSLSAGLVVSAALASPTGNLGVKVADVLLWVLLGSVGAAAAARLLILRWRLFSGPLDLPGEIGRGNAAAGAVLGAQLIGTTLVVTAAVSKSGSVVTFVVWCVTGLLVLVLLQLIANRFLLPRERLFEEVTARGNWGAGALYGGLTIVHAVIVNTFLPASCANPT